MGACIFFKESFVQIYDKLWNCWIIYLVSWGTSILFSIVVVLTYIPENSWGGTFFIAPYLVLVIYWLVKDGHSDWCEVLTGISLKIIDVEHFSCACWSSVYLLGEMSIQVFCPFFYWIAGFLAVELYMLFLYFRD